MGQSASAPLGNHVATSPDRSQALGMALELERVERQAKQGVLTTLQLKRVLNDVSEKVPMKLTGHSSKAMNTRYTHLEMGTLKNAVTSLPLFNASPQRSGSGSKGS